VTSVAPFCFPPEMPPSYLFRLEFNVSQVIIRIALLFRVLQHARSAAPSSNNGSDETSLNLVLDSVLGSRVSGHHA
jgi:hypothetical protein